MTLVSLLTLIALWAVIYAAGMFTPPLLDDVDTIHAEAARDIAKQSGAKKIRMREESGDAADALISVAEDTGADCIVVGSRGMSSATRFVLGSVPNRVSHHAPCDVLIVHTV